jgi:hypothetical protein
MTKKVKCINWNLLSAYCCSLQIRPRTITVFVKLTHNHLIVSIQMSHMHVPEKINVVYWYIQLER